MVAARRARARSLAPAPVPGDDRDTALAEGGMRGALPHVLAAHPAPLTLLAARPVDADDEPGNVLALIGDAGGSPGALECDSRHDEERGQELALGAQELGQILRGVHDPYRRLEPASDQLAVARRLERLRDLAAHLEEPIPFALERLVEPLARRLRKSLEVHTLGAGAGQVPPRLFAREREDRRHEARQRGEDVVA